ncbi:MAG: MaoC family dehydratase N-terminal domain-containing protein [Actinomycetota bacterium]|nr:MaoC family dehydratase N-terminal domain-containing protein [Actinomycetota bacterium]
MTLRLEDLAVGDALPSLDRIVTPEDVKAYAGAGGDQNPLHQDDAFARSVGFDGIVAHGMFTMGHMAACVTRWAGEEAFVTRIAAQFRAAVFMQERITAAGRVREIDRGARSVTLDLWVSLERDGATEFPIKRGEATVHVPDPG